MSNENNINNSSKKSYATIIRCHIFTNMTICDLADSRIEYRADELTARASWIRSNP